MNAYAAHRAISAYNKAQQDLRRAQDAVRLSRCLLIELLKDYPVTTDDLAIRHHILNTERRELTDEDRRFLGMEDES